MRLIRREALLSGVALLGLGRSALADDPPPSVAPSVTPPPPPPVPSVATTPTVAPTTTPGQAVPRPANAPAPANGAIDRTKAYYVYFDQNIDVASMRALRRQCTALVEAGVTRITIVLHSTGGLIDPTLTTYSYLRALPCTIDAHALGFIASAANLLFLVGERRTANRNCRFLFHPTTVPMSGTMNTDQMRDRITQFDAITASILDIYRERTSFTPEELARFGREEVIYTTEQARQGGLIHEIKDLQIPDPSQARVVFVD